MTLDSITACPGQLRGVDVGGPRARPRRPGATQRHRLSPSHRTQPSIIVAGSQTAARRVTGRPAATGSDSVGRRRHRRRRRLRGRRLDGRRSATGGRRSSSHGRVQGHRHRGAAADYNRRTYR